MVTYGCKLQEAEELPLGVEGGNGDEAASGGGGQHSGTATPQPGAPSIASNSSGSSGALEEVPYRYQLRFSCGGGEGGQQQQTDGAGDGLGVRAKFVIGADGYYSRVRRMVSPAVCSGSHTAGIECIDCRHRLHHVQQGRGLLESGLWPACR